MHSSRRTFLKTTAVAALGFPAILRASNPNSKLQVAAIGCSGKGLSDINEIGSHSAVKYVGFADVDSSKFEQAARKNPVTPQFADYREMFAKLGDKFDAVIVSGPDHMHAPAGMLAMGLKKHVYCQKPLTHTLWEARQMRLAADNAKVITQMGNQIHSSAEYRSGVKLIQSGAIGKIKEVHSWQMKTGNAYTNLTGEMPPTKPAPETLNWDLWIGPAPMRDYSDAYHPQKWRDWQDFGGGVLGDFGCHIMDPVFCALELQPPISVKAENDGLNPQTWPVGEVVFYTFPGTQFTTGKTLPLTWYDGGRKLPDELAALIPVPEGKKAPASGSLFVGEGGYVLLPHVGMPQLLPKDKFASQEVEKVPGSSHYHAWVDGILENKRTTGGFHYAGPLTETVHLGNIATRVPGTLLEWDPANLRIPNSPAADKLITKAYREGWGVKAA